MKIGLALPHYDFSFPDHRRVTMDDVVAYARRAEDLGFDSVWVSDHLFLTLEKYGGGAAERYRTPEALAMCAAVMNATTRIRFGALVLCASFRHPRLLAHAAESLNEDGRFECGLGSGWLEDEFREAGIPFGTAGERIERLRIVAERLRGTRAPRVWIGGKGGPKIASVVAAHAHGWNVVWRVTPAELDARLVTLRAACARVERDPSSVAISVGLYTLLGTDEADLAMRFKTLQAWRPGIAGTSSLDEFRRGGLVGTPDECARTIEEFEARGVSEIIVGAASLPFSVYDDDQLEMIARELIPRVR